MFRIVKIHFVTFKRSLHAFGLGRESSFSTIKLMAIFGRRILGNLTKYLHTQNKHRVEIMAILKHLYLLLKTVAFT